MKENNNVNRKELVNALAKESGLEKQQVKAFLNVFPSVIKEFVKEGKKVSCIGFATFEPKILPARQGTINGVDWTSPEKTVVGVKLSKNYKDLEV